MQITGNKGRENMFLSFMRGLTRSIMKQNGYFYLFDSHTRDEGGLNIVWRTSMLLTFSDLTG